MQINRLFEIIYLLMERKSMTAKELAAHFEVSVRTIYRDIDTLGVAGIPIYTVKGKGGGIRLMENFVLNRSVLSDKEQEEILSAIQGVSALGGLEGKDTARKLTSFFGSRNPDWIAVDFQDWGNSGQNKFTELKQAILQGLVVSFQYYNSSGEGTVRSVEPKQLVFKDKNWYLSAWCRKKEGMRFFKLTRMKGLKVEDEHFDRTMPVYEGMQRRTQQKAEENKPPIIPVVDMKLKIAAASAYRVYEEFEEPEIKKHKDGSFTITVSYPENEWIYGMLLSYGQDLEVLKPGRVRREMKNRIKKMAKLYS